MTRILIHAGTIAATLAAIYAMFLSLLTTRNFQAHVVYLHCIQMTWSLDLNVPEQFGFLRNQVTSFEIPTPDNETLHAWHILPVGLYAKKESMLLEQSSGIPADVTTRLSFKLLQDDPEAILVIYMHGAAGTMGSGYRVPIYRALSAGYPDNLHVLAFDYRGFGHSSGWPSERGLIVDAVSIIDWAMHVANIPPSRILIFGQSLGTAVDLAAAQHYALQPRPVVFAGSILVAPFTEVAKLAQTYRIGGYIPILSPLFCLPISLDYVRTLLHDTWLSHDRIRTYVKANEVNGAKYRLTLIHAEDEIVPWHHTRTMFWYAFHAANCKGKEWTRTVAQDLGAAGSVIEYRTDNGIFREQILKSGLHDALMSFPVITLAVKHIFDTPRSF